MIGTHANREKRPYRTVKSSQIHPHPGAIQLSVEKGRSSGSPSSGRRRPSRSRMPSGSHVDGAVRLTAAGAAPEWQACCTRVTGLPVSPQGTDVPQGSLIGIRPNYTRCADERQSTTQPKLRIHAIPISSHAMCTTAHLLGLDSGLWHARYSRPALRSRLKLSGIRDEKGNTVKLRGCPRNCKRRVGHRHTTARIRVGR